MHTSHMCTSKTRQCSRLVAISSYHCKVHCIIMGVSTARVFFTTVCVWLATSGALLLFRSALLLQGSTNVLDLRSSMECSKGVCQHGTLSNQEESRADWRKDELAYSHDVNLDADQRGMHLIHPQYQQHDGLHHSMTRNPHISSSGGSESTATGQQAIGDDPVQQFTEKKAPPPVHLSQHTTMVKLGTDLKLNISHHCPAGSFMLRTSRDSSPKHSNCPTLYIVGARKGGTSSLYQYVSKHPDFQGIKLESGVQAGEAFYFQKSKLGSWKHYISLFPTTGKVTGESSVAYLVGSSVPRRLYEMCGEQAKVVMLLRDPVRRLESNFLMRVKYQTKSANHSISPMVKQQLGSYLKAVRNTKATNLPQEWSKLVGLYPPAKNMVFEGLYYVHLLNWLCNFPAENILIINSEEFYRNSSTILDLVFQFLGLKRLDAETYDWITSATYNKGNYTVPSYQKLSDAHIEKLLGVYGPFNRALLELLHWENHQWLTKGVG